MFLKIVAAIAVVAISTAQQKFIQPDPIDCNDHAGWQSMFDGATLKGWDGSPDVWRVGDGAIVGESTPEKRRLPTGREQRQQWNSIP
jgi:hypothetical protein